MTPEPKRDLVMREVTDPQDFAAARAQRERADRNAAWLQSHAASVYARHRGRHICVAGEEVFAADTAEDALALARAAHPEDDGRILRYIPREKVARVCGVVTSAPEHLPRTDGPSPFQPTDFRNGVPLLPRRRVEEPISLDLVKRLLDEEDPELLRAGRVAGRQRPPGEPHPS